MTDLGGRLNDERRQKGDCAPCVNGDHYYCILNRQVGLRVRYMDPNIFIEKCECLCDKGKPIPKAVCGEEIILGV